MRHRLENCLDIGSGVGLVFISRSTNAKGKKEMYKPLRMENENHRVKRTCTGKCSGFIEYYRFKKDAMEFARELQKHSSLCDLILVQKAVKKHGKEIWITLKVFQPLEYYIPRYKDDSERPL